MTATRLTLALVFVCATTWAETAPTVTCKDGTTSKGGRGACRGHGGVDRTKAAGAVVPAPAPSPAAENARPAAIPTPRAPAPGATEKVARSGGKSATDDPTGALAKCRDGMYWRGNFSSGGDVFEIIGPLILGRRSSRCQPLSRRRRIGGASARQLQDARRDGETLSRAAHQLERRFG